MSGPGNGNDLWVGEAAPLVVFAGGSGDPDNSLHKYNWSLLLVQKTEESNDSSEERMAEDTAEEGWRANCAGGTVMIFARTVAMSGKISVPHVQTGLAEAPTKITLIRANMSNVFFVGCCLLIGDHAALSHVLE